ncbi:hypothetical protein [Aeromicrobium sp.]|uniref:hypothetical protein n=1 Tax=Aeromicrobium sp. TaxID=1871063 RepID=UPI0025BF0DBB|nr:hypothetical protein [Aeromicrobium sp.]MCK5891706.1 hypothetical protein [Aeromicrobium sp.]
MTTHDLTFAAFVDESGSNRTEDPGTYILSAAILDHERLEDVRDAMRGLILPGQKKLHWRDEGDKRQLKIATAVARLEVEHVVVVRSQAADDRPERRRRACMELLAYELDQLGVGTVTLESRGKADDNRDREVLNAYRRRGSVSTRLRMHHEPGPAEPLLWVPDAVCGAMVSHRTGDTTFWDLIRSRCSTHEI